MSSSSADFESDFRPITLFLCGDVMTGRGIDQILPHSVDPQLHEQAVKDARRYVNLAEKHSGSIPRNADPEYIWGEALEVFRQVAPTHRIVNLETAVTTSDDRWPEKGIHYRMHPDNVSCLTAANVDCCVLANNHVLDWGYRGLRETVETLEAAGMAVAGAGQRLSTAQQPACLEGTGPGRVLVFAVGSTSSGIPPQWAASATEAGVHVIDETSSDDRARLVSLISDWSEPEDVVVVSIHWGPNWGYDIARGRQTFARALIDSGQVDVIHGHSSHHVKGIEMYRNRPILYGCGDFLTDYEGIAGREGFRDDLGLMYFVHLTEESHSCSSLEMHPTQIRRFRITQPPPSDATWLERVVRRESEPLGTRIRRENRHLTATSGADT